MKSGMVEELIEAAMMTLHHDASEIDVDEKTGVEIVAWEKQLLRDRFSAIIRKYERKK